MVERARERTELERMSRGEAGEMLLSSRSPVSIFCSFQRGRANVDLLKINVTHGRKSIDVRKTKRLPNPWNGEVNPAGRVQQPSKTGWLNNIYTEQELTYELTWN